MDYCIILLFRLTMWFIMWQSMYVYKMEQNLLLPLVWWRAVCAWYTVRCIEFTGNRSPAVCIRVIQVKHTSLTQNKKVLEEFNLLTQHSAKFSWSSSAIFFHANAARSVILYTLMVTPWRVSCCVALLFCFVYGDIHLWSGVNRADQFYDEIGPFTGANANA